MLNESFLNTTDVEIPFKILILSCKDFSDLWSNNLSLFSKYWPNHPEIIISSDGPGLFDVQNPSELRIFNGGMSTRIIKVLKTIETEYVFLTFDDYFLKANVNVDFINQIILIMHNQGYDYCRFFKNKKVKGKFIRPFNYKILPLQSVYEVNLYPGLWRKKTLLSILKDDEDIWKTEVRLTRRMRENGYSGIAVYNDKVFPFVDVVRKGKYLKSAYRFLKKNKLFISARKIRTTKETLSLFIKTQASRHLPRSLRNIIKKMLNKKGVIFYSDYEYTDD